MHCLSRGGGGTWHNIRCLFQKTFSDLFASASCFTLLSSKEKGEADSSQMLSILLFVSFFFKSLLR